nr:hypothetical protein [Tanacetum cinerariifolium]
MANLSEDIQCAGSDTRPPMLDRTDFASLQQQIRLYCQGKDNRVNILKSIDEGPYKLGTFRETFAESTEGTPQFGPERPRVYSDLNSEEKDWYNADIWATNILLQWLPKDIYTLINHYTDAKDIWDNVKMLLEGSELTKEDRDSQLGLRDSNYDQLFAYLKQHEAHAKENKMMLERLSQPTAQPTADPLALLSNVSNTQHGSPSSTLALLTQSYRTFLPQTNNQLRTSSNARNQATVQDGRVVVQNVQGRPNRGQGMNPRGGSAAGYGEAQNRVGNAQENGVALDAEQLLFLVGGPDNAFDDDVDEQPIQDLALNVDNMFQAKDCDAFDSDVDEAPTAQPCSWPICHQLILLPMKPNHLIIQIFCLSVQLDHVVDLHADYTSVSNMIPYDQYVKDNKVAIGYKNPLCLTHAKQAQPALYNGHEILKDSHAPTKVHNAEDTLEIAEINRKKMNPKMTDPECVTHKVKIAPHDYTKENFLATFTPQKQLTPKQIYWSNDLMKLKSEALKEWTKVSRPIKAFTVYPPNTPATLVPKVLPTTSQVKIHIFTLIQ